MARKLESSCLGELSPQYKFFLNPYSDVRFVTSCPGCNGKTKQRKLPLAIHVHDWGMVILNKTCRFCPFCDLLIAHQDDLETLLADLSQKLAPLVIGCDYFVLGTVERAAWRRGLKKPLSISEFRAALHDFKDHVRFQLAPSYAYTRPNQRTAKPLSNSLHKLEDMEGDHGP